jgi:hypothetical protein
MALKSTRGRDISAFTSAPDSSSNTYVRRPAAAAGAAMAAQRRALPAACAEQPAGAARSACMQIQARVCPKRPMMVTQ